jgi:hypothetical protein
MILDMGDVEVSLILGRPFLNTTNTIIYVGSGQIHFQFSGWKVKCNFNSYIQPMNRPRKSVPIEGINQHFIGGINSQRMKKDKLRIMNLLHQSRMHNLNRFDGRRWHHHLSHHHWRPHYKSLYLQDQMKNNLKRSLIR